jgi:hypothetical protein
VDALETALQSAAQKMYLGLLSKACNLLLVALEATDIAPGDHGVGNSYVLPCYGRSPFIARKSAPFSALLCARPGGRFGVPDVYGGSPL